MVGQTSTFVCRREMWLKIRRVCDWIVMWPLSGSLVPGMLRFHFKSSLSWRATTSDRSLIRMRNYGLVIVQFPLTRLHAAQGDYNPVRKNGVVQGRRSCVRLRKTKKQTTMTPLFAFGTLAETALRNFNRRRIILCPHLLCKVIERRDNNNDPNTLRNPHPSETDLVGDGSRLR